MNPESLKKENRDWKNELKNEEFVNNNERLRKNGIHEELEKVKERHSILMKKSKSNQLNNLVKNKIKLKEIIIDATTFPTRHFNKSNRNDITNKASYAQVNLQDENDTIRINNLIDYSIKSINTWNVRNKFIKLSRINLNNEVKDKIIKRKRVSINELLKQADQNLGKESTDDTKMDKFIVDNKGNLNLIAFK